MGDASYVFNQYIRHLKDDIKAKPSMGFFKDLAPVKKLSSYYVIGNTTGKTECFIDTHGGNFTAEYVLDNMSFTVPAGVTLRFFQPHGFAFGAFKAELRNGSPQQDPLANDLQYAGGDTCPNYILTKFQGRHSGMTATDANKQEVTYQGFQAIASDANIVLVTVRNRWFHAGVTLKDCVKTIRKEFPGITTFNCMFCRVDDSTQAGQLTWNASSSTGGSYY